MTRRIRASLVAVAAMGVLMVTTPLVAGATALGGSAGGSAPLPGRTFTFSVHSLSGWHATGQAQVDNSISHVRAHMHLSCLVIRGETAYVGGTIVSSTNPGLVGAPVLFAAKDGDDLGAGGRDQVTGAFAGSSDCTTRAAQTMLYGALVPTIGGDVEVEAAH